MESGNKRLEISLGPEGKRTIALMSLPVTMVNLKFTTTARPNLTTPWRVSIYTFAAAATDVESPVGHEVSLTVNGQAITETVEARTLLVDLLRERLGLTGTHVGCDTSQCGACVVHVDGRAVKSCALLAVQLEGCHVVTIEGIAEGDALHPMQAAFHQHHGLQCGFCTPGMVMSAIDLLKNNPHPSEREIREGLEGNLCRCTGYHNIVKAIAAYAEGA